MAEALGEAILILRTDDSQFEGGITRAEAKARGLGGELDKASGSSRQLAGEMLKAGRDASAMGEGFSRAGQQVEQSSGAQRAALQNLGFQLNDVVTMYSLGADPMRIFASQGGQIIQVLQQMAGASAQSGQSAGEASDDLEGMGDTVKDVAEKGQDMGGKFGAVATFLAGPWGIALTVAIVALAPLVSKLFEAEDALEGVEFASDKLGDAQAILGRVINETTGQIEDQTSATLALARAQAVAGLVGARQRQADARSQMQNIVGGDLGDLRVEGHMGGLRLVQTQRGQSIVDGVLRGRIPADVAERQLRAQMEAGIITESAYFEAASSIANFGLEGLNEQIFEDTLAALDGDPGAARRVLGAGGSPRRRGGGPRTRTARTGRPERSAAELEADYQQQSASLLRDELQARLDLATDAQERADLQSDLLSLERENRIAEIEASDLTRERKDALLAQVEAIYGSLPQVDEQGELILSGNRGLGGMIIARELTAEIERETMELMQANFAARQDSLGIELELADTEAQRKDIALRLLDAEEEYLEARLRAIIEAESSSPLERQIAQIELDALQSTSAARRQAVGRANETTLDRYLRELQQTPAQINEALELIQIDGLDNLNQGLVDAITGVRSLGDVFSGVADQIISDLLRIAVQQTIIGPLARQLFGAGVGGGPDNLLSFSSLFAGFFADGGRIPFGQFGIVGEEGPELAFATPGGLGILSNSDSRALMSDGGGSTNVSIPISIDAPGADAAQLARVRSEIERLRAELPSRIISTVQDADSRRVLALRGR